MTTEIQTIVDRFVTELEDAIEERAKEKIARAFGILPSDVRSNNDSDVNLLRRHVAADSPVYVGTAHPVPFEPSERKGSKLKRPRAMTPALAAARKMQGRYLGLMRSAKGRRREHAKRLAAKSGVKAAISFLRS